jgi:hypothetical protein
MEAEISFPSHGIRSLAAILIKIYSVQVPIPFYFRIILPSKTSQAVSFATISGFKTVTEISLHVA